MRQRMHAQLLRPACCYLRKLMMPCLLFFDAFSDHACLFLCVGMHLETELLTHEDIPMTAQERMVTHTTKHLTRAWRTDRTCAATRRRTGLTISPSISRTGSLRKTTRLQGQASPSFRSKIYAALVKTCARRNTAHLHPLCAQRTSLRASDSPDKVQHQLSPPKLRIPIPYYTSYNTISSSYTSLPGVMTALALQTSLILVVEFHAVCRCTICTGGQRGAHPWDHNDGPRGHFHKCCNQ